MTETKGKGRRRIIRAFLAMIAVSIVCLVQLSPNVAKPEAPVGTEAVLARDAVARLRDALKRDDGNAVVSLSRTELQSGAALASWVGTFGRIATDVQGNRLIVQASRPLVGPLWLNLKASIESSDKGFPRISLTLGRLPLGTFLTGKLLALTAHVLRWRGVKVPPLDTLVQNVAITPQSVTARVHFPLRSGLANNLASLRNAPIDPDRVTAIYCRLMMDDKRRPDSDLARVINRAFLRENIDMAQVDQNRAALVAVAMYAVSPAAGRLAGDAQIRTEQCARTSRTEPVLAGRADLAKHWSLSAAFSVALGDEIGKAMGEWKELADSRPTGTGFSFVDLSADRSGLAFAKAASDEAGAFAFAEKMRRVTNAEILPVRALALSEGISEAQFVSEYHNLDAAQFNNAIRTIDRVLSTTIVNR